MEWTDGAPDRGRRSDPMGDLKPRTITHRLLVEDLLVYPVVTHLQRFPTLSDTN